MKETVVLTGGYHTFVPFCRKRAVFLNASEGFVIMDKPKSANLATGYHCRLPSLVILEPRRTACWSARTCLSALSGVPTVLRLDVIVEEICFREVLTKAT